MYKKILVPVVLDHSRNVDASLEAAQALADDGAEFVIMHVVQIIPNYVSEYIPADFIKQNRAQLEADLQEIADRVPNARVVVTEGKAGMRVEEWAASNDVDCIVIASHTPKMSDILLGSTAHHVVRHAKCAVHVVR